MALYTFVWIVLDNGFTVIGDEKAGGSVLPGPHPTEPGAEAGQGVPLPPAVRQARVRHGPQGRGGELHSSQKIAREDQRHGYLCTYGLNGEMPSGSMPFNRAKKSRFPGPLALVMDAARIKSITHRAV
jgi:hypothetical protein